MTPSELMEHQTVQRVIDTIYRAREQASKANLPPPTRLYMGDEVVRRLRQCDLRTHNVSLSPLGGSFNGLTIYYVYNSPQHLHAC